MLGRRQRAMPSKSQNPKGSFSITRVSFSNGFLIYLAFFSEPSSRTSIASLAGNTLLSLLSIHSHWYMLQNESFTLGSRFVHVLGSVPTGHLATMCASWPWAASVHPSSCSTCFVQGLKVKYFRVCSSSLGSVVMLALRCFCQHILSLQILSVP